MKPGGRKLPACNQALRFIREKLTWQRAVLLLGILIIIAVSVAVWQMDINWNEQVKKYGFAGVFVIMLGSSMTIFFPLPGEVALFAAPGIMEVSWIGALGLGLVASAGASLGELTAYFAGLWGRVAITEEYQRDYGRVERGMRRYGGPGIFIFALTPLPFDVVGIAAGSLRFPIWEFLLYCWTGRLIRELLIVYGGWLGWGSVERFFL